MATHWTQCGGDGCPGCGFCSPKLSATMQDAVEHAKKNGGCLVRYPGGFWCRDGLMERVNPWWGTSTVEGLVKRGVMVYTEWKQSEKPFPIRAKLAPTDASPK